MKRSGRACLDAFAWPAWLQDEPGAAAIQRWLDEAEAVRAVAGRSHSDSGVMKGRANFWGKIAHEFTPLEGEAIRDGLVRRLH